MSNFYLDQDIQEICERLEPIRDDLAGKTLVLAGARGFLGRYFVAVFKKLNESYLSTPCKMILIDNFITSGKAQALDDDEHVRFLSHDICQPIDIEEPIDYVIHAAGIASPFYYRKYPMETLNVAVDGSKNLLALAKANRARYSFFSSSEIYGDPDPKHVPTAESYRGNVSSQGPRACYDESKRLGETLCYIYHTHDGVETNVIRPFNVYGPGMQERDYRVLPNFANRVKGGRPLQVYGSGNQTRTYCYVVDAMDGFLRAILRGVPGEAYNIGNPKPEISVAELVKVIEGCVNQKVTYDIVEYPDSYPADEPNRRCPDIRKARFHLEYEPQVTLEDGLRRFFSWTQDNYTGEV